MHRRPAPLLPAALARLIGFALLATVGAVAWRGMAEAATAERALVWVAVGIATAVLLLGAERAPQRLRSAAATAVAVAGVGLAVAVSGLDLAVLRPSRWNELADGLLRGTDALGGARLPYRGADPWPAATLELSGSLLVTLAAVAAFWPRAGRRGWPAAALCALLVLAVSPVVALAGDPSPVVGLLVAVPTACFLFLERMSVRPGLGAAVLAVAALLVALPLGAAADREEPWFDYKAFAESLGPVEPVAYRWEHGYGPMDWPRDGRELFRARTDAPSYWKAQVLERFDGERWRAAPRSGSPGADPAAELPADWRDRDEWSRTARVTLRRLQTETVVGPGTIVDVRDAARGVRTEPVAGGWLASRRLGRGDSYVVQSHVASPSGDQLSTANTGWDGRRAEQLVLRVPFRSGGAPEESDRHPPGSGVDAVELRFAPFGLGNRPTAHYPGSTAAGDGADALRRTPYRRTWRLARRLRDGATNAFDYVQRVNAHLRSPAFRYTERPGRPPSGVPPLEHFLHDSRRGYCQHFSGAMALLLRMGGVPARVAGGFSPGGFRRKRGEWVVRDVDAHSWVEAWFDDFGWVTFDPTPPATPARSQVAALDVPEAELPATSSNDGSPAVDRNRRAPTGTDDATGGASAGPAGGRTTPVATGGVLLLVAAGAAAVGIVALARRRAGSASPEDALAELERALRRVGRPLAPNTTLACLEAELGRSPYIAALRASRYAADAPPLQAADRTALRRALAAGRGWRGRLQALRALPPRLARRPDLDSNQGPTP